MPFHPFASTLRPLALTLSATLCLALAACGGGGEAPDTAAAAAPQTAADETGMRSITAVATTHTLLAGTTIPGHPHKVDVYRPAGATKAIVFLHGHGGRNWQIAYDLGLNRVMAPVTSKNVNWDWLSRNGVIAVFPQGQSNGGASQPTWSNYIFNSGQDDVAFLRALSTTLKTQYGATEVSLSGHSSGGTMTARMWCEGTTSFKAFVSLAGPMVSPTYPMYTGNCTPLALAPYFMIVGDSDTKLPSFTAGVPAPTPEQIAAGLTNTVLTAEWSRHRGRSHVVCGETPGLTSSTIASSGPTWISCGSQIRFTVVKKADHPIASLEQYAGFKMVDAVTAFTK